MIDRNDFCWCGSGKKWKKCHYPNANIVSNMSEKKRGEYLSKFNILIKNEQQIEGIRAAGHLAAKILDELCLHAQEGVTTQALDELAVKLHNEAGAVAAPLGYGKPPFPKSICTSLNDVICHGIPDERPLEKGDILNIDVTAILHGFYGDCSKMVIIGETSEERKKVVEVSYEALMRVYKILKPGMPISAIGETITDWAHSQGCSVVYQFIGHGVGLFFHENPQIPHCRNSSSILLIPGMTFTVEPMINAGSADAVIDEKTEWIASTVDGRASAQWEHTFLITEGGAEILTPWKK